MKRERRKDLTARKWQQRYEEDGVDAAKEEARAALEKMLNLAATCEFYLRRNPRERKKVKQAVKKASRP